MTGQVVRLDRRSLVWRAGVASVRFRARTAGACVVLVALVVLIAVVALGLGSFQVSAPDVVRALFRQGPQAIQTLVVKWRLSRVVLALLIGVALGASGAVFQSLTRNPLGSPDIVGFSSGAYAGAVVAIILVDLNQASVVTGALIGGLLTAAVVYLLAYRQGVQGFRLIVVGIAVTAMLGSATTYLLVHTDLWRAAGRHLGCRVDQRHGLGRGARDRRPACWSACPRCCCSAAGSPSWNWVTTPRPGSASGWRRCGSGWCCSGSR